MIDSVESSRRKGKSNYKIITLENADANDASINAILGRLVADRASPTRASFGAKVEMRSGVLILYSRDMWEQDLARRLQSELSSTLSNVDVRCVLYKTITNQESIADPARDVICLVGSHFYGDPFDPDLDRLRDRLQQLGTGKRLFPVLASDKSFVEPRWLAVPSSEILDYTARSQQEIESQLPADIAKRFTKQRAMAV